MQFTPNEIKTLLSGLEKTWFPNELAFLYSNSRTEFNVRDKFNIHFANLLKGNDQYFIQREWFRKDLAIIKYNGWKTEPVALFEFKARHTFFIGRGNGFNTFYGDGGIKNGVKQDIEKLLSYSSDLPCYHILIGVHPLERIPSKYEVFQKDCKEIIPINKAFNRYGSGDSIKERCYLNVKTFCEENDHDFIQLEYSIGKALEVNWEMIIWVLYKK
ncbi:hypothetical protein IM538_14770 [Cytobacillus suaedae]|nr:hypothetical protein IM538_14770 [Cytobacillus suaedae]